MSVITLTQDQLDNLLESAAERGAERALAKVGLSDEYAGEDVRDIRSLLKSWRRVKKGFWSAMLEYLGKMAALVILGVLVVGVGAKLGLRLDGPASMVGPP
jgi:hypothetical protein